METSYKNISYFFIGILICTFIGFHQSYTVKFPTFEGLNYLHHFHGAMMMGWFAILIVQPFLIRYKKYQLHRNIGKISYVLLPMVLYSIFLVAKVGYLRSITLMPKEAAIAGLTVSLPDILVFGLFYVMAMVYRKNANFHARFMIGTSLLMIGPGVGRAMIVYGGLPFPMGFTYSIYLAELVALVFLILDIIKRKSIKPFAIILAGIVFMHICWVSQMSAWWQGFGVWFVGVFF